MKTGRTALSLTLLLLLFGALGAQAQNQIQNPGFINDLSSWTLHPSQDYSVAWNGSFGNNTAGSAYVNLTTSTARTDVFFLTQCVAATGSTTYDVGGSFLYPSGVATTPDGSVIFQPFSDSACGTSLPGLSSFGLSNSSSPANTWITQNYLSGYTTPAGTVSVLVYLELSTFAAGASQGFFDDIRFIPVKADLAVTKKSGRATAVPGQPITYTIVASNAGPSTVVGAIVTDTLPAVITNATWTCVAAGNGFCTASGSGNINDSSVSLTSGDSVTYTLTGTVSAAATGTLSNTASVAAPSGTMDPTPANNSATDTIAIAPIPARSDFNGDGKSDVSLQNSGNGAVAVWLIDGTTITSGAVVNPGTAWKIVATGDFDGDGKADLLLQNPTTGDVAEWRMNGALIVAGTVIASPGIAWKVMATGDFNGDGKSDIVLQNSATGDVAQWQMNGMAITAGGIVGSPGTAYKLVAAGDFNGDGKSDVVLQSSATGDVAEWQLNGMTITAGGIVGSPGTAYKLVAAGDLNNDGQSDLVLQNTTTGDVAVWMLNGATITAAAVFGGSGSAWKVIGTADFNGDGKADVVLQNSTTGDVAEWQLNNSGTAIVSGAILGGAGTSWVAY